MSFAEAGHGGPTAAPQKVISTGMASRSRAQFVAFSVAAAVAVLTGVGVSVYFACARKLARCRRHSPAAAESETNREVDGGPSGKRRGSASTAVAPSGVCLKAKVFFGSETGTAERVGEELAEELQDAVSASAVSVVDFEVRRAQRNKTNRKFWQAALRRPFISVVSQDFFPPAFLAEPGEDGQGALSPVSADPEDAPCANAGLPRLNVILMATHGEGEVPESAVEFERWVRKRWGGRWPLPRLALLGRCVVFGLFSGVSVFS